MPRVEPGLTLSPSPKAIEIVKEWLHHAGLPVTQAEARSLVEAVLAVEAPRMQAISRGIVHGSLETIRQTAEVALSALREGRSEPADLVGAVKEHLSASPRPVAEEEDDSAEEDARPVFKRPRGR